MTARLLFRFRTLINCGIVLLVFVPAVLLMELLPFGGITILALIGVFYYVFFYVLEKRAVGITCSKCEKYISTNTPWECGFCHQANRNIVQFPFVHQCEHCQAEPKAYQCHHCGKLIFLDADELAQNFARCLNAPVVDITKEKVAERKEAKEALIHEIEMTRLAETLQAIKRRAEWAKDKDPMEEIETHFKKFYASQMGAREYARRQRAIFAEEFKDDPEALKNANATLEAWLSLRVTME